MAFSASKSYQIPTDAFKINIVNITNGSTHAGTACSSL